MISIIICSRTPFISKKLSDNIAETIGCNFELIIIDNSQNQHSIFEAYNTGVKKSIGTYWCFIHDDILFRSQDWGKKVISIFDNDIQIGLIGVAGSKIKTRMPSAWWDCPDELMVVNITHHLQNNQKEVQCHGFNQSNYVEVAVIDGVFMAARSNKSISFDDSLTGFHHYDLFLCLQYLKQKLKIVVTNQVLIEHFSIGTINKTWVASAMTFDKKYGKMLPLNPLNSCKSIELEKIEFNNGKLFIQKLFDFKLIKTAFFIWLRLLKSKPISKFHFEFLNLLYKRTNE